MERRQTLLWVVFALLLVAIVLAVIVVRDELEEGAGALLAGMLGC